MDVPELIRKEGLRRGLSPRTIKTYRHCVKQFFKYCSKDPKKVKKADVKYFLDGLIEKDFAGNTINIYLNALKFFYERLLNKKLTIKIKFSKTPKTLPEVLTKEEVKRLIKVIHNPKHRLIVTLMYAAGLRVSELVNLKVRDFEFSKNYGWVRKGKGNKDRLFIIAKNLKDELVNYVARNCPSRNSWLFKGWNGWHISTMTVHRVIKKAAKKAGIGKNVHPHTLRHSFATHLIENGYDVASVQSLLGHTSSETTMEYLHMASPKMIAVKSPYDTVV